MLDQEVEQGWLKNLQTGWQQAATYQRYEAEQVMLGFVIVLDPTLLKLKKVWHPTHC